MMKTTENTGLADNDSLKKFLSHILAKNEKLYIVTSFIKGSQTDGKHIYLAFTSTRIIEFMLQAPLLAKIGAYSEEGISADSKHVLEQTREINYNNKSIKAFILEDIPNQKIMISFINTDTDELEMYMKETSFTSTYLRYLSHYSDKVNGHIE